jgi:3'-5' exoribonuclease
MKDFYCKDAAGLVGSTVTSFFLVTSKQVRLKRDGGSYLHLICSDRSGQLSAKLWDGVEMAGEITVDDIVKVRGRLGEYQGRLEITIDKIRKAKNEEVDLQDFLPATLCDIDQLWCELQNFVGSVHDLNLQQLLKAMLVDEDIARRFRRAPAAKVMHHAYLGGLLEHVVSLCSAADLIQRNYPWISRDLLLAGAILHDLGKLDELTYDRAFNYTDEGRLLGHMAICLRILREHASRLHDFPGTLLITLEHLILSHHGKKEFGSPVEPAIAEAILLHFLDNLDSKLAAVRQAIEMEEGGSDWTERVPALGRAVCILPRILTI